LSEGFFFPPIQCLMTTFIKSPTPVYAFLGYLYPCLGDVFLPPPGILLVATVFFVAPFVFLSSLPPPFQGSNNLFFDPFAKQWRHFLRFLSFFISLRYFRFCDSNLAVPLAFFAPPQFFPLVVLVCERVPPFSKIDDVPPDRSAILRHTSCPVFHESWDGFLVPSRLDGTVHPPFVSFA